MTDHSNVNPSPPCGSEPVSQHGRARNGWRWAAAGAAGLLLATAYPPVSASESAWVAFAPLLAIAWLTPPRLCFRYGFFSGAVFWLCSLSWLLMLGRTGAPMPLAILGWTALALYCALYTGLFLYLTAHLTSFFAISGKPAAAAPGGVRGPLQAILVPAIALCWVGLEYLRATLFSGFPWNGLGVSQYRQTVIIQAADWGGVYAVSALVMTINVAIVATGFRMADLVTRRRTSRFHPELLLALTLTLFFLMRGGRLIREYDVARGNDTTVAIRAIQPNVQQVKKWPDEFADQVYDTLRRQTELAAPGGPDLIVWPETALPDAINLAPRASRFMQSLARHGTPILAGALELTESSHAEFHATLSGAETRANEEPNHSALDAQWIPVYHNSALLFAADGSRLGVYRKRHLVPFGEYLPLDNRIHFIRRLAPLGFSCEAGREIVVFRLPLRGIQADSHTDDAESGSALPPEHSRHASFSALICFEDVFAYLSRDAVRAGARFLANLTNDAWFDGTAASVQHLSHAVFRCVENRVPMVRSANTGITGFISRSGRLDKTTVALIREGATETVEIRSDRLLVPAPDMEQTFYTRKGDRYFAQPAALAVALSLAALLIAKKRRKKETSCKTSRHG